MVGYARTTYSGSGANITVITRLNPAYNNLKLRYFYNKKQSDSSNYFVSSGTSDLLKIRVEAVDDELIKATLILDELDFIWNHPAVNQPDNFKKGQKGAIIEMFGWPYDDIAQECEMIGKAGYMGIKVFPPQ